MIPHLPTSTTLQRYKITVFEYEMMLKSQNGVCAVCKKPPDEKPLVVDHCHFSGLPRGLLHQKCNIGIGHFNESAGEMMDAIRYLRTCEEREHAN